MKKNRSEGELGKKSRPCFLPANSFFFDYTFQIFIGFAKLIFKEKSDVLLFLQLLQSHNE